MRQKLFTVEDDFKLSGREGIVVVGELDESAPTFRIGSAVLLLRPDGSESTAEIGGIETVCRLDYENYNWNRVGVMLKGVAEKADVPIGTEIFLELADEQEN